MALEKNIGKNETIELFDDKSLYKFVKKGKLKRKNSFDRASIDGSEYLYGLRTSHSICTSVESSNSNEIKKKFSSLKTNIIGEKLEETLDEKNELRSFVLDTVEFDQDHTSNNISSYFDIAALMWGIEKKSRNDRYG